MRLKLNARLRLKLNAKLKRNARLVCFIDDRDLPHDHDVPSAARFPPRGSRRAVPAARFPPRGPAI